MITEDIIEGSIIAGRVLSKRYSLDKNDSEDLCQDCVLEAYRVSKYYKSSYTISPKKYITSMVYKNMKGSYFSNKIKKRLLSFKDVNIDELENKTIYSTDFTSSEVIEIKKVIDTFTSIRKQVLLMHFGLGTAPLTTREISRNLKINRNIVISCINCGIKDIRKILNVE